MICRLIALAVNVIGTYFTCQVRRVDAEWKLAIGEYSKKEHDVIAFSWLVAIVKCEKQNAGLERLWSVLIGLS